MINGTYSVIYIKIDGVFLPVGLQSSDSFEESSDMIDTTTRDNSGWKTSIPTNQGYNISFEGLIINTNFTEGDSTKVSLDRLRVLKRSRTKIEWKTENDTLTFVDSGYGYITSLSKSSTIDEFRSFSANIEGFGAPVSTSLEGFELQSQLQYRL